MGQDLGGQPIGDDAAVWALEPKGAPAIIDSVLLPLAWTVNADTSHNCHKAASQSSP